MCRALRKPCTDLVPLAFPPAGIAVAMLRRMRVFALSDETIRIPKRLVQTTRPVPQQFAPARRTRWPWLIVAALAGLAFADPVDLPNHAERSALGEQLLRSLAR